MHDASRATSGALPDRISTEANGDTLFPPAVQILAAADNGGRARILLRLPDVLIVDELEELVSACHQAGFGLGLGYLHLRFATLAATRCIDGTLPAEQLYALARWRADLAALAEAGT